MASSKLSGQSQQQGTTVSYRWAGGVSWFSSTVWQCLAGALAASRTH